MLPRPARRQRDATFENADHCARAANHPQHESGGQTLGLRPRREGLPALRCADSEQEDRNRCAPDILVPSMSGMIAPGGARRSSIVRIAFPLFAVTMVASSCAQPNLRGALVEAGRYPDGIGGPRALFRLQQRRARTFVSGLLCAQRRRMAPHVRRRRRTTAGRSPDRDAAAAADSYRDFLVEYPPGSSSSRCRRRC